MVREGPLLILRLPADLIDKRNALGYARQERREGISRMENTCVIACAMLRDELEHAMAETGCSCPVTWLDAGLHNYPDRLRRELQGALDRSRGYQRVLLAYGFCGHSVAGIRAGDFEVILPRADDCITLLLGSQKRRMEMSGGGGTYFLTRAWLRGERNLREEYESAVEKYGQELGRELFDMMFGNYRHLALLDDGCYGVEQAEPEVQDMARLLDLSYRRVPASDQRLRELLTGPWPEEWFLRLRPGEELTLTRLMGEPVP